MAGYNYSKGDITVDRRNGNIEKGLIKSTKRVHRAVSEDFDFLE